MLVHLFECSYGSQAQGMSGRSLRRLPVLSHARYMGAMATLPLGSHADGQSHAGSRSRRGRATTDVMRWLDAMDKVVDGQATERRRLNH